MEIPKFPKALPGFSAKFFESARSHHFAFLNGLLEGIYLCVDSGECFDYIHSELLRLCKF
jgi:hypothetical protein